MTFTLSIDSVEQLMKFHLKLHELLINAALDNDLDKITRHCAQLARLHQDGVVMAGRLKVAKPVHSMSRQAGMDALATRK